MIERDMRPAVTEWLRSRGYTVAYEIYICGGYCDVVGFRFAKRIGRRIPELIDCVTVELKVRDFAGVLHQGINNSYVCPSYVAMPKSVLRTARKQTIQKFVQKGVGILSVGGSVQQLVAAYRGIGRWRQDDRLRKKLWRHEKKAKATQ